MDNPVARPVPGIENGSFPVFSPDGQWLAFITGTEGSIQLKKVPIAGGAVVTLTGAIRRASGSPTSWGEDGNLLLGGTDLQRVSDSGGQPAVIAKTESSRGELAFLRPHFAGGTILATILTPKGLADLRVVAVAVATGEKKLLLEDAGECLFAPTGGKPGVGHLVYARDGSLFAATFNAATLK